MPIRLALVATPLALFVAACSSTPATGDVERAEIERDLEYPTYDQDTITAEARNAFGQASAEIAEVIADVFENQGRPQAYIAGEEAGGAVGVGVTYGKGRLFRPGMAPVDVYWQGPSVGFDLGADGSEVFTLVYDLGETENLYQRFPGAEGNFYVVGGVAAEVLSTGETTVVPIRTGVGLRTGVNVGYMNFTRERRVIPF